MRNKLLKISIVSAVFILLFPLISFAISKLPEHTSKFYVNDFAGVIESDVEEIIIENGNKLDKQTGAQIVLVTVDFTDGISIDEYATELFNKWGIGSAEKNNGLLILLSIGDEDYWAVQGKGLEVTLTSGDISQILWDYLEPDFDAGDYSNGALKVYEAFVKQLGGNWASNIGSGNAIKPSIPNKVVKPSLPEKQEKRSKEGSNVVGNIFLFLILYFIISSRRTRYSRRRTGFPFNIFNIFGLFSLFGPRRYGPRNSRSYHTPPPFSTKTNNRPGSSGGAGRSSSGRSSGGSSFGGGGGKSRGGGAGRRK